MIRLEHIREVAHCRIKNGNVILKFRDSQGVGPVTRELTAGEAADIEACLQRPVVYRQDF